MENIYFLSEISKLVESSVKNISAVLSKQPASLSISLDYSNLVVYKKEYKPIFHYISFSVLCGEYYDNDFDVKVIEIENNIKILSEIVIPNNTGIPTIDIIYKKLSEIKNDILDIADHFILFYKEFDKKLKNSLNNDNKIFIDLNYKEIINAFDEEKYIRNFSELNVNYYKWIFCVNLYTAQLDEGYVCDRDTLYELIKISFKIRKIHFNRSKLFREKLSVTNTTFYKCDFLILKLLYRLNKTENKDFVIARQLQDSYSNIKKIEYVEYSVSSLEGFYRGKNNIYIDNFFHISKRIYEERNLDLRDSEVEKEILNIKTRNDTNGSLVTDAHFLCKIIKYNYKEIINNSFPYCNSVDCNNLINKINYNFEQKLITNHNVFHKYSNESGIYLSKNAIIKLRVETILIEIDKINDVAQTTLLVNKIIDIINITDTHLKIKPEEFNKSFQFIRFVNESCTRLLQILRKKINNLQIDIYDDEFENFISRVRKINNFIFEFSNVCLDNISDAKDRKYLPIYLSLQECIIENTTVNIYNENKIVSLFIDSSYILPSKYEHLRECISNDINKFRNEEFSFFNSISSNYYKSYEKRNNEIIKDYKDESEKSLTTKLKDNQVSYVQIIGLYASIITFVLGSISIIPKFENGYTSILTFMFVFASCLCLFVFLLKTIFDVSDKSKTELSLNEYLFFAVFLIVFIGSMTIIQGNRKNDKDFRMTISKGKSVNDSSIIDTTDITIIKSNYIPPKEKEKQ